MISAIRSPSRYSLASRTPSFTWERMTTRLIPGVRVSGLTDLPPVVKHRRPPAQQRVGADRHRAGLGQGPHHDAVVERSGSFDHEASKQGMARVRKLHEADIARVS